MVSAIHRLFESPPQHNAHLIVTASVVSTLAAVALGKFIYQNNQVKIIPSPRKTLLPLLTEEEKADLPYPPDAFPGARDVTSPYGTIRVYEWGPEDGKKVLFVHGISTPCVSLGRIANGLAEKGCRVMLMDLFGRGYSDECADLDHDERLYSTQIMIAITSSPLSWTGKGSQGGFSIVGYSLGGGIAAAFTSFFPDLVSSLVLLAPAGIMRPYHISSTNKFLYSSGILPENLLQWVVNRKFKSGNPVHKKPEDKSGVESAISTEATSEEVPISFESGPLSTSRPHVTAASAIKWQVLNHQGFINSFMSSIRFGPIMDQQVAWSRVGQYHSSKKSKVLIIAGKTDTTIIHGELKEDAEASLGKENMDWRDIDGGHDFPITKPEEVIAIVAEFWGI